MSIQHRLLWFCAVLSMLLMSCAFDLDDSAEYLESRDVENQDKGYFLRDLAKSDPEKCVRVIHHVLKDDTVSVTLLGIIATVGADYKFCQILPGLNRAINVVYDGDPTPINGSYLQMDLQRLERECK